MKAKRYLAGIIILFALTGCTYENRMMSPMTQSLTRDYFYLISSEEDLDYIEKNYQWKISESDEYPLSKYNYVF